VYCQLKFCSRGQGRARVRPSAEDSHALSGTDLTPNAHPDATNVDPMIIIKKPNIVLHALAYRQIYLFLQIQI